MPHTMERDGSEQLLVKVRTESTIAMFMKIDQRLKCFQRLESAFETNRSWLDVVSDRGLRHDRANQIVRQNMCPDFLANEFRRFAAQHVHLHRGLDRSQIQFVVPAGAIQLREVFPGR